MPHTRDITVGKNTPVAIHSQPPWVRLRWKSASYKHNRGLWSLCIKHFKGSPTLEHRAPHNSQIPNTLCECAPHVHNECGYTRTTGPDQCAEYGGIRS